MYDVINYIPCKGCNKSWPTKAWGDPWLDMHGHWCYDCVHTNRPKYAWMNRQGKLDFV